MHTYSKRVLGGRGASMRRGGGLSSFSLVEVVIAIAVAAFGLVSILGLMFYASQTVQQSDKYARLSSVASQLLATLGSQSFRNSPYGYALYSTFPMAPTNCYYTSEGLPTNAASAFYQCTVADATPAAFPYVVNSQQVMEPLVITIRWPNPAYSNTNIIVTSVLNYGIL